MIPSYYRRKIRAIFGLYWLGGCGGALLLVLSICTGIVSLPLWLACLPFALPVGILFVSLSGLPYFKMISWYHDGVGIMIP